MRILLDTSAYSALRKGHAGVLDLCSRSESLCLNAIVVGELLKGFRKGGKQRQNELGLRGFLSEPRVALLAVDEETADCYAEIAEGLRSIGKPIGANDVWIAASAMQHGIRLVTTDEHFRAVAQIAKDVLSPNT